MGATITASPLVVNRIPSGFVAIPIAAGEMSAAVRVCVLVRTKPHAAFGHFVRLRESVGSRVLLGCLADSAGRVDRWLEIHVQSVDGYRAAPPVYGESLSNAGLDERWTLDAAGGMSGFATGFEGKHPPPTFLDLKRLCPVHPVDEQGRPWELCRDEAVLSGKGMPSYGASLHRYLYVRGGADLIATGEEVPAGTRPLSELPGTAGLVPFNAACGLLRVVERLPCAYEAFVDAAGAEPAKAAVRTSPFGDGDVAPGEQAVIRPMADGALMLSRHGRWGRRCT